MTEQVGIHEYISSFANAKDLQAIIKNSALRLAEIYGQNNDDSLEEKLLLLANFIVPNDVDTLTKLSSFYYSKHQIDKAIKFAETILKITKNKNSYALLNAGILYSDYLCSEKAISCFKKSLKIQPDCYKASFGLGVEYLKLGNFSKGWKHYYDRHKAFDLHEKADKRILRLPLWDGKSSGKVLFYNEQGYGDFFFSLRYLENLPKNLDFNILVDKNIFELMKNTKYGVNCRLKYGKFDYRCSLLDIPYLFKINKHKEDSYKYIFPNHQTENHGQLKIGIVFSGNPNYSSDFRRSIKLSEFSKILDNKKIKYFLLQKDTSINNKFYDIKLKIKNLADGIETFEDTKNVLLELDGLITVDTGLAHLSGCLGIPTFVLLDYSPDFRWQNSSDITPWYKSWKLFKQTIRGSWSEPLQECQKYIENEFISLRR